MKCNLPILFTYGFDMVRYVLLSILGLLVSVRGFQTVENSREVIFLSQNGQRSTKVRVLMATDEKVAFVLLKNGKRYVKHIEDLGKESRQRIENWKKLRQKEKPKHGSDSVLEWNAEEEFQQAWRLAQKRRRGSLRAAKSNGRVVRIERSYGNHLVKLCEVLRSEISDILEHEKVVLAEREKERLTKVQYYLNKELELDIKEVIDQLDKRISAEEMISLRKEPLVWPDTPLFPLRGRVLNKVRHVHQLKSYCGPATAEMMVRYHGLNYTQRQLAPMISKSAAEHKGTFTSDMVRTMRDLKLPCVALHSERILGYPISQYEEVNERKTVASIKADCFAFIKKCIEAGSPIITTVKHGNNGIGHFVCVIGYDEAGDEIVIYARDPLDPPGSEAKQFSLEDFVKYWIYDFNGKRKLEAIVVNRGRD